MTPQLPPDILEAVRTALGAQYEIDRELGSGAMGSVLLAHDRTLERPVAVKIIPSQPFGRPVSGFDLAVLDSGEAFTVGLEEELLLVDPETAALVDARSESTVAMTFEAGMLRQSFTQHGRQEIRQR